MRGLLWALCGWLVGTLVTLLTRLIPLIIGRYRQAAIGYGDVKLIALVGAYLGPINVLYAFFFFSLFYGICSVLKIFWVLPWKKLASGAPGPQPFDLLDPSEQEKLKAALNSTLPLAPAIALGTFCTIVFFAK
jgi:prepilin signal peptidase PulO-like enzyme (type II secretory pathway)